MPDPLGYPRPRLPLVCLALCLSCGGGPQPGERAPDSAPIPEDALTEPVEGRPGGILDLVLAREPETFNLAAARDNRSKLVAGLTTATLLEFDPISQTIQGGITRNWTFSQDGSRLSLELRRGLRFSDGQPLTSQDVALSFEKIYQEESRNELKGSLLIGGRPIQVRVLDAHRLELIFPEPVAAAESILANVPVFPSLRLQDRARKLEEYWTVDTPPSQMAGLGPFTVARHEPGLRTVLEPNPHYWRFDRSGKRLPYLDGAIIHYVEDRNNQLLRFQNGEIDLLDQTLRPEDMQQLERLGRFRLHPPGASNNLLLFWFNLNAGKHPDSGKPLLDPVKREWFADPRFRRAVNSAISRDTIVRNIYLGFAQPAWGLVPQSIPEWHEAGLPRTEYSPEAARALLREAGYAWIKEAGGEVLVDSRGRPVRFELLARSDDVAARIGSVLVEDLARIGVRVDLRQEEFRSLISRVTGSFDYQAALLSIVLPVDPSEHVNVLLSSAPMHMWAPNQPEPQSAWEAEIDQLMRLQMVERDRQERRKLYGRVQRIMAEQLPIIPLVNPDILVALQPALQNVQPSNLFPYGLSRVWGIWEQGD